MWRSVVMLSFLTSALASDAGSVTSTVQRIGRGDDSIQSLRIAVFVDPNPITYISGQSMRFRTLLQHLADNASHTRDEIHLVTTDKVHPHPPTSCYDGKIPIHYTCGFRLPPYPAVTLAFDLTAKVLRLCRAHTFDVLHVTSPGSFFLPVILASRIYRIPILMSYHTHLPIYVQTYFRAPWNTIAEWILWKVLRWIHSFADLTLVTSPQIATNLAMHGIHSTELWPKGVNTTQFHPQFQSAAMRERMSSGNPNDFLLVYVGRLAREKRLTDLKSVLETLLSRGIPARLCIVGDGPQMSELQETFQDTPTTILGSLQDVALSEAFASGDVFVMPSDSETLGFVVMESLASGVPVVASRAGGLMDLINDETTGFLVPTNDTSAFVEKIELLYRNPTLRNQMGLQGRIAATEWSWEASMNYLRLQAYPRAIANFVQQRSKSDRVNTK